MNGAIALAPLMLFAAAATPAAAEPPRPSLKLQSMDLVRNHEPPPAQYDPAFRHRLFQQDEEILPAWTLPFGLQSGERNGRAVTFSVRPGRGLKARARIRF